MPCQRSTRERGKGGRSPFKLWDDGPGFSSSYGAREGGDWPVVQACVWALRRVGDFGHFRVLGARVVANRAAAGGGGEDGRGRVMLFLDACLCKSCG